MKIGQTYHYIEDREIPHHEYEVTGYNQQTRFTRNKNYFILEVNDIIQKRLDRSIYDSIAKAVAHLFRTKVFLLGEGQSIEDAAAAITDRLKVSEVEIAFDIAYKYGIELWKGLGRRIRAGDEKLFDAGNTRYYNNSYLDNHRHKWKVYDRSRKDRIDVSGNEDEERQDGDVYRFEITLGRVKLKNILSVGDLRQGHSAILAQLQEVSAIAFSQFFGSFDYTFLKGFIEDLKMASANPPEVPPTTRKNYLQVIRSILFASRGIDRITLK